MRWLSCSEPIDTTSPAGRFAYTLLAAVAIMERQFLAERTKSGPGSCSMAQGVDSSARAWSPKNAIAGLEYLACLVIHLVDDFLIVDLSFRCSRFRGAGVIAGVAYEI